MGLYTGMEQGGFIRSDMAQTNPRLVSRLDVRRASLGLVQRRPYFSCSDKVRHGSVLMVVAILFGMFGLSQPALALSLLGRGVMGLFAVLIAMRGTLALSGAILRWRRRAPLPVQSEALPIYTALVPLYREASCIPKLVGGLRALNYPKDKLEVFFLVEADDLETQAALACQGLPERWPVLILPDGQPRTKPRALNVALSRLSGEIVTIYDAEDVPHPDQLLAAVAALRAAGPDCACVQAPLRAHNYRSSWIAGQWALEYDVHFGLILPALARARLPIALGGTSNHFRTDALRAADGWDAWNVTEDADLGLRFARLGYLVDTITPPTLEEAPERLDVWVPQRSRWIKGYMQSLAVVLRQPRKVMRQMGLREFVASTVLLGGAIISAVIHGPLALMCLAGLLLPGIALPPAGLALLVAGYGVNVFAALCAPRGASWHRLGCVLSAPLYWPLQSLAAARALYELAMAPHIWSKTPHGLTAHDIVDSEFVFS